MQNRTDLALEKLQSVFTDLCAGIKKEERENNSVKITEIIVETDEAGQQIGKGKGRYITVEVSDVNVHPDDFGQQADAIGAEIVDLSPKEGLVLIVGLGNNDITPDALGPQVINRIISTRHFKDELPEGNIFLNLRQVSALAPGVLGQTGIEVAEIIKAVCDKIKPSVVVVIDALACSDVSRLGTTIQITNTGISPGSGVQNKRKELSQAILGVPVIAIGVPTVVDMHTIVRNVTQNDNISSDLPNMMVTPRDIDKLIEGTAKIISYALNRAFHPDLSIEDITSLS